jgi:hypothetical protein
MEQEDVDVFFVFFGVGGSKVSKTLKEALYFDRVAIMGYAIDNDLHDCRGWRSVRKIIQHTTNDDLISCNERRVGQMKQDKKNRS